MSDRTIRSVTLFALLNILFSLLRNKRGRPSGPENQQHAIGHHTFSAYLTPLRKESGRVHWLAIPYVKVRGFRIVCRPQQQTQIPRPQHEKYSEAVWYCKHFGSCRSISSQGIPQNQQNNAIELCGVQSICRHLCPVAYRIVTRAHSPRDPNKLQRKSIRICCFLTNRDMELGSNLDQLRSFQPGTPYCPSRLIAAPCRRPPNLCCACAGLRKFVASNPVCRVKCV
eukprot:3270819-Amphidinium_carterae.1